MGVVHQDRYVCNLRQRKRMGRGVAIGKAARVLMLGEGVFPD